MHQEFDPIYSISSYDNNYLEKQPLVNYQLVDQFIPEVRFSRTRC
jgi:hypothetical protein